MRWKERVNAVAGTEQEFAARLEAHLNARAESAADLLDADERSVATHTKADVQHLYKLRARAIKVAGLNGALRAKPLTKFADAWFESPCTCSALRALRPLASR